MLAPLSPPTYTSVWRRWIDEQIAIVMAPLTEEQAKRLFDGPFLTDAQVKRLRIEGSAKAQGTAASLWKLAVS